MLNIVAAHQNKRTLFEVMGAEKERSIFSFKNFARNKEILEEFFMNVNDAKNF